MKVRPPSEAVPKDLGEGLGHGRRRVAQVERHPTLLEDHIVEGEPHQVVDGLGVEQDLQRHDPVSRLDSLVGEHPSDQREVPVPADRRQILGADHGDEQAGRASVLLGPAQENRDQPPARSALPGVPGVEVALSP